MKKLIIVTATNADWDDVEITTFETKEEMFSGMPLFLRRLDDENDDGNDVYLTESAITEATEATRDFKGFGNNYGGFYDLLAGKGIYININTIKLGGDELRVGDEGEAVEPRLIDAMVLWEAFLDDMPRFANALEHGICECRDAVAKLVPDLMKAYEVAINSGFDKPFDWEFCPWFLDNCINPDLTLKSDYLAITETAYNA